MRNLFFALCVFLTSQVFALDTLAPVQLSAGTVQFLELEKQIGEKTYDLKHVSRLQVYASKKSYLPWSVEEQELKVLGDFSIKALGIYEQPIYTPFQIIQSVKKLTKRQFESLLNDRFFKVKRGYPKVDVAFSEKVKTRAALKAAAIKEIVDLLFPQGTRLKQVAIYDLLDNYNENVDNTQFMIVSLDHVVLMNYFYWL